MYRNLVKYYERIFPLGEKRRETLLALLPAQGGRVLDVGCATGELLRFLVTAGWQGVGVDPEATFLEEAHRLSRKAETSFLPLSAQDLPGELKGKTFQAILCLGNTLAHLHKEKDLQSFLRGARQLLNDSGVLVLQLANFERLLRKGFPLLSRGNLEFQREYHLRDDGLLEFCTELFFEKKSLHAGTEILRPWNVKNLELSLGKAGFAHWDFFGDLDQRELTAESPASVVIAKPC